MNKMEIEETVQCFFQFTSYSRTHIPVSTHKKRQSVEFPVDLSIGKKLKRAIDRQTVIRISESGKLLLVESGIQEFFFRGIRNPGLWKLTTGIRNPQCGLQNPSLSCPVFFV